MIPVVTLVISMITQAFNVAGSPLPAPPTSGVLHLAAVSPAIVGVSFFRILEFAAQTWLQWAAVTGSHSGPKNLVQLAKGRR